MHQINFYLTMVISAIVPLVVGFIWYNPKVFGTAWLKAGNFDGVKMKEGFNMPLVFGLTFVFGFFVSMLLSGIVIHQMGCWSMMQAQWKTGGKEAFDELMKTYGGDFRTFKHGALHGTLTGVFIAMPIIAITGMFERRGFKYIAINTGYWILSLLIMGGIICQFADPTTM